MKILKTVSVLLLTGIFGLVLGQTEPTAAAMTPDIDPADVVSLFSNAYTNAAVDTWSADWDVADVADVQVAGDDVKLYTNLSYAGIEFANPTVDASGMNMFHMDIWTPDDVTTSAFKVKLVDFGADGAYAGGDDVEHELTFDAASMPPLMTGAWVGIDVPLSDFTGLTTTGHLAQMIISGDPNTVYVDNVFFYYFEDTTPTEPTVAAMTPDIDPADVVSLFSNAYTNAAVDTWSADWDVADVADVQVAGDDVKLYTNLSYAGIEFANPTVDASGMNMFHMDIWTPDDVTTSAFKVKLVDFGADGAYAGGDDVEHELTFDAASMPPLMTGAWVGIDVPLSDFTGLTTTGHLAQMIISGDPNTVYVDNVFFYYFEDLTPTEPTIAAPMPTAPSDSVISIFSDAYFGLENTDFAPNWGQTTVVETIQIESDNVLKYSNMNYQGTQLSNPLDLTGFDFLHVDYWTVDADSLLLYLISQTTGEKAADLPIMTGTWVSADIPLTFFTDLGLAITDIHQFKAVGTGTVYLDNIYFYKEVFDPFIPGPHAPVTFEDGEFGSDWSWTDFDQGSGGFELVDNPAVLDPNMSAKVGKFTAGAAGAQWAGTWSEGIGLFDLDSSNCTVKMMVYKSIISDVLVKFENAAATSTIEVRIPNTLTDQWEEMTFDFGAIMDGNWRKDMMRLVVIPDFAARTQDNVVYFDNITFNEILSSNPLPQPTVAAPVPTHAAHGILASVFSDTYTQMENTEFNPNWGQGTVVETVQIEGNNTLKYSNLGYQGTQFEAAHNLSDAEIMHVDFWTPNASFLKIYLISQSSGEKAYEFTIETEAWQSVDIPMSTFTDQGLSVADIHQLKIEGTGTIYFDNIYFFDLDAIGVEPLTGEIPESYQLSQNYPNPFNPTTAISYGLPENSFVTVTLYNTLGQKVSTLVNREQNAGTYSLTLNGENLPAGLYFYEIRAGKFHQVRKMTLLK